jgi:hypothetical protein
MMFIEYLKLQIFYHLNSEWRKHYQYIIMGKSHNYRQTFQLQHSISVYIFCT